MATRALMALALASSVGLSAQGQKGATTSSPPDQERRTARDTAFRSEVTSPTARRSVDTVFVLGGVRLPLTMADSIAAYELWLGHEHERAGRKEDAALAYERVRAQHPGVARSYAEERLRVLSEEERASNLTWLPSGVRDVVLWLESWKYKWDAFWIIFGVAFLAVVARQCQKARTQVQIEQFTRQVPAQIGIGLEDTIADIHKRTVQVSQPLGVIVNSGLKLPVLATSSDAIVQFVEIVSPKPWIPKAVGWMRRWAKPKFIVSGHMEGTLEAVRIVVALEKSGDLVREWDVIIPTQTLREGELNLALQVIHSLAEYA